MAAVGEAVAAVKTGKPPHCSTSRGVDDCLLPVVNRDIDACHPQAQFLRQGRRGQSGYLARYLDLFIGAE